METSCWADFAWFFQQFKLQFFWGVYGIPYHTSSWFVALFFNCKNICFKADFPWATLWPTCRTCRLIAGPIGGISRQLGPDSAFVAFNFSGTPGAKRRAEPMDQLSEKIPLCAMTLTLFYHVISCFCSASVGISIDKSSMMYEVCSMMYALSWWWFWWFWCWWWWWWWWWWGSGWDDDDDDDDHDSWWWVFGLSVGMPALSATGHRPAATQKKNYPRCLWVLLKSQPCSQDQRASVSTRRPWAKRHWILSGSGPQDPYFWLSHHFLWLNHVPLLMG